MLTQASSELPPPIPNELPCIQDAVVADILSRKQLGLERYGTVLQPFNGRRAGMDMYQEQLDQTQYTKQWLMELDFLITSLRKLATKASNFVDSNGDTKAASYVVMKIETLLAIILLLETGDPGAREHLQQELPDVPPMGWSEISMRTGSWG